MDTRHFNTQTGHVIAIEVSSPGLFRFAGSTSTPRMWQEIVTDILTQTTGIKEWDDELLPQEAQRRAKSAPNWYYLGLEDREPQVPGGLRAHKMVRRCPEVAPPESPVW